MSQRGPEALLRPKSIAAIGASSKPQRALAITDAQLAGGNGPVMPVPRLKAVSKFWHGLPPSRARRNTPDLAVLCTNAGVIELLEAFGQKAARPASSSSQPVTVPARSNAPRAARCVLLGPNSRTAGPSKG